MVLLKFYVIYITLKFKMAVSVGRCLTKVFTIFRFLVDFYGSFKPGVGAIRKLESL
jgi:hypothetical protein